MFSGNLLAGQHDTQKERPPPSKPIPVTFPYLEPPAPSISTPPAAWTQQPSGISAHFLALRKPSDVTDETLSLLNVTFQSDCDFETLLSSLSNNALAHLPPKSWLESPGHSDAANDTGSSARVLSNGRNAPEQRDFHIRARELFFKNSDAFSTLTRKSSGGQAPLRLAHFRKFWEGLDNMAYYWDNSLDEYTEPVPKAANDDGETDSATPPVVQDIEGQDASNEKTLDPTIKMNSVPESTEQRIRKKAKPNSVSNETATQGPASTVSSDAHAVSHASQFAGGHALPARRAPQKAPWAANLELHKKPLDLSQGSYRGYRIGNGAEMPDQYRIDCVRAFLEPISWAFGVTFGQHRRPPVLTIGHVRFPVRMSSVAGRGPQDRMKARSGWMEGPVMGLQCRAGVDLGATGKLGAASVLDAVRELGGLLLLAQERSREGLVEIRSGDGKWWTTNERWGGGPGGEVEETTMTKVATPNEEEQVPERNQDGSRPRRRPTPGEIWKILKPGNPLWDPKVAYEAIGRDRKSEWDDVGFFG